MSLIVEGGRVPAGWTKRETSRAAKSPNGAYDGFEKGVRLALINNMPDSALEDTELQFFELLDSASGNIPVYVKLYSLTGVPRSERGQQHLESFYFDCADLWQSRFDGAIITGTEPKQANLREEPYWKQLTEVLDWAERNTSSTILSCLAAHASVLYSDNISRYRLPDKQFGVFQSRKADRHPFTRELPEISRFPHSRWNEVQETDLTAAGYSVLTKSTEAGVDLFTKKKGQQSLFVYFQGHPEYNADTLAKEYRRDIKRFLRGERDTYPSMPLGYFDIATVAVLQRFQKSAISDRCEEMMASFPSSVYENLQNTWRLSALGAYRNWLGYVISNKTAGSLFTSMSSSFYRDDQGKRGATNFI
jgi:homoserine O-succinyltransferase/O-acetyltransferase